MCYYERANKSKINCVFYCCNYCICCKFNGCKYYSDKNPNDNTLLAIEDDNFTPQKVDYVPTYIPEPKIINDTNLTNKTDWMNNANITNILNKTKGNLSNLWNEYSHW